MQNDVRGAMFFISRELRMIGAGVPAAFAGYVLQGIDNETGANGITPDRLRIMGNIEDPLVLTITSYSSAGPRCPSPTTASSSSAIRTLSS